MTSMGVSVVQAVSRAKRRQSSMTVVTRSGGRTTRVTLRPGEMGWTLTVLREDASLVAEMGPAPEVDAWCLHGPALVATRAEPHGDDGIVRMGLYPRPDQCAGSQTMYVGTVDIDPDTVAEISEVEE